ncbi:MAG: MFS transporter [Arcanobacterium sp.]|nr:MFS transporter [Arcanobacterium sp.]
MRKIPSVPHAHTPSAAASSIPPQSPLMYLDMKRIFPLASAASVTGGFYLSVAGAMMAIFSRDLGVSVAELALLGSMYGVSMVIRGLSAPYVLRFGPVWLLRLAPVCVAIGVALMIGENSALMVLLGAGLCAYGAAATSIVNPAVFVGREGVRYLAIITGIASTVSIISPLAFALTERLWPGYGRFALLLILVPALAESIMAWRAPTVSFRAFLGTCSARSVRAESAGAAAAQTAMTPETSVAQAGSATEQQLPQLTKRAVALQVLRLLMVAGVEFAFYAWSVERLMQVHATLAQASALATVFAVGMAVGRIGAARLLHYRYASATLQLLGLIGAGIVGFVPSVIGVGLGLLIAGLGTSCLFAIAATDFSGLPTVQPQAASSVVNVVSGIGALLAPLALGAILTFAGLQVGFVLIMALYLLLFVVPRPRFSM